MALEFEKLTTAVADMARHTSQRRRQQQEQLQSARQRLADYATAWDTIDACLDKAMRQADEKFYRSARPLNHDGALNEGIPAPDCPAPATIIASDGSQIVPDRHAPFLYYLLNVGIIIYHHGRGLPPETFTRPTLDYPKSTAREEEDSFTVNSALVNVWRDQAEIETLADTVWHNRDRAQPLLALIDQRLLYWPAGGLPGAEGRKVVEAWQVAMTKVRDSGGLLAGYIDRPGKRSVLSMLHTLDIDQPDFDVGTIHKLGPYQGLTDTDLFAPILKPGERSKLFIDISQHNKSFRDRDPDNQVCFFYLNPGQRGHQIARVDVPMSVAREPEAVAVVHALIYDQCRILGDYPYVITRADEVAVVGKRDQQELDNRIALKMESQGVAGAVTAKQQAKEYARSSKTRHEVFGRK